VKGYKGEAGASRYRGLAQQMQQEAQRQGANTQTAQVWALGWM
jgi:hypothetical protein